MNTRARGFTMIELMVALVLGLVISAAAIQLFLTNQISMNFQRGMNDVLANGRFVIDQMVSDVRLAGLGPGVASSSTASAINPIIFATTDLPGLASGSQVSADNRGTPSLTANDGAGILAASDQIVVQHLAMTATVDCEGNSVSAGTYVISRYFVRADTANNNVPALACDAATSNGSAVSGYGDGGVVLVDGVDSFQVLYGIDDGPNNSAQVTQYVTATAYNALSPKPVILAVRIGLYLQSGERAGDVKPPTAAVQVLDQSIAAANVPDDARLRRLFISTVGLRNASSTGV